MVIKLTFNSLVEGMDYIGSTFEATFPEDITFNGSTTCIDVTILDDVVLEGSHSFSVEVSSNNLLVTAGMPSSAPVVIMDDERMKNFVIILIIHVHT